jgi:hypothetical protein
MLDVGPVLDPNEIKDRPLPEVRSFVDVIRRLQIPYYEEARQYFSDAVNEGWYGDQNEASIHQTCKSIIQRYESAT